MKKALIATLVLLVLGVAMVPAWAQGTQVSFNGVSNARALDLSAPALRAIPGAANAFKGLTVGLTSASFDISPSGRSVSGVAAGQCEFIASTPDSNALPCTKATLETSSLSSPGGAGACAATVPLGVVDVATACGKSASSLSADGLPNSLNSASIAHTRILADLTKLGLPVSAQAEAAKDLVIDQVIGLTGTLLGAAPSNAQTTALKDSLNAFLNSIKDGSQFASIQVGAATTNVIPEGAVVSVSSEAAGAKIGLLGLTNPLVDGLVMIEVSSGVAKGSWNGSTGLAQASAVAPFASVKVRDVADLIAGNDYIAATVPLPELVNVLGTLNGTALESSVDVGTYTKETQSGKSVSAFTSGVTIHAVKGLGESSAGAKDGGLIIRVASADVKLAGNVVSGQAPCCALATTGGPVYAYLAGAALLAFMALTLIVFVRRLRSTTS